MCGICGVVSNANVVNDLFFGIKQLEYRGYDSCGMAIINGKGLVAPKNIGSIDEVDRKEDFHQYRGNVGISHTRWATHGSVTQKNSHPHLSQNQQFAIVHNGIISNFRDLRQQLINEGYLFSSETDSEVFAHLMDRHYKLYNNIEEAIAASVKLVEGSYAICLLSVHDPKTLYCIKNESPLVLGIGEGTNYVASDFYAFVKFTRNAVILDDREIAVVSNDSYYVRNADTGEIKRKNIFTIDWSVETSQKGGYPHYMLKEIYEQPESLTKAFLTPDIEFTNFADILTKAKEKYFVGVGTTFYVAEYGKYFFADFLGEFCPAISSDEFNAIAKTTKDTAILCFSQSGETYDTLQAIKKVKDSGGKALSITNVMGSTMARMCDATILQKSGPEICVISTKAALSQMALLSFIGLEAAEKMAKISTSEKEKYVSELKALPELISKLLNERSGFIHSVAKKYADEFNWLFLGKGIYYAVAQESALKLKEVAYVHAEAMPCGFLKHGTIALIDEKFHSMVFVPHHDEECLFKHTMSSVEEIKARKGATVGFHFGTNVPEGLFNDQIVLPEETTKMQAPFIQLVAAQLFSYYVAYTLKRDIDKPRNLAKSVTVG
ncbi:MAG: glutamine--fructose-6-phosphate transaminase (isomerizing) [Nitrospinae bacterium]|nr:glutamine--fructose-6-phosphate transaminase (isomerizing) [Nitrospinota bacterium]